MQPDFYLEIKPALTLDETRFKVVGTIEGSAYHNPAQLAGDWLRDNHPNWLSTETDISNLESLILKGKVVNPKVSLHPLALSHHVFDNSESSIPVTDKAELNNTITNSSSIDWSEEVSASYTIGVEAGGFGVKASASTTLSASVGHDASKSKTIEVGNQDGVDIELPPHSIELAVLYLEQGTIELDLVCEYYIRGYITIRNIETNQIVKLSADTLQRYNLYRRMFSAHISVQFAGESEIKTATLDDDTPEAVDRGISGILSGVQKVEVGATGDNPNNLQDTYAALGDSIDKSRDLFEQMAYYLGDDLPEPPQ